jgi:predicted NUDIX family NTP pyrophosphohydrolase
VKQSGAMFLVNRDSKILLVHPSGNYNRRAPWLPPKEEMEANETPREAARRAVVEELGLTPDSHTDIKELGTVTYKTKSKIIWGFAARYLGKDDAVCLDWENDRYGWFTAEEAQRVVKEEFAPLIANAITIFRPSEP